MTRSAEGEALLAAGRIDAAVERFQAALAEDPGDIAAVGGLARCAEALGLHRDAEIAWARLHQLDPDDRDGLIHVGLMYQRLARYRDAVDCFSRIVATAPDDVAAHTARVQAVLYSDQVAPAERQAALAAWGGLRPVAGAAPSAFANPPEPDRPLRIGYLSSDFRAHPTGMAMLPVCHFHRRPDFRICAYADVDRPDPATEQLRARCDEWHDIGGLGDDEVARRIAADGIDILVVLTPHMDRNRPFVCRYRPAPVQMAHHDTCSTCIPEIDYFIGDFTISPRRSGEAFSERVLRLPCWTVQAFPAEAPDVGPSPAARNGYVTFGSFNNPVKLTDTVLDLWGGILAAVPDSRLYLKYYGAYDEPATAARLRDGLAARGIAPGRLRLQGRADSRSGHFAHYGEVDIALDPFPFNGATTTFEALLMGVPVVALLGDHLVARSGASLLHAIDAADLVAADADAYRAIAVALAGDRDRLAVLRAGLRERVKQSRLVDARRYTRNLERYYRATWRRWCAGR